MGWEMNKNIQTKLIIPPNLKPKEQIVYDIIKDKKSINIDILCHETKISSSDISVILLNLERNLMHLLTEE